MHPHEPSRDVQCQGFATPLLLPPVPPRLSWGGIGAAPMLAAHPWAHADARACARAQPAAASPMLLGDGIATPASPPKSAAGGRKEWKSPGCTVVSTSTLWSPSCSCQGCPLKRWESGEATSAPCRSCLGSSAPRKTSGLHVGFPLAHRSFGWFGFIYLFIIFFWHRMGMTHLQVCSGPQLLHFTLSIFKTNDPSLAILRCRLISPIKSLLSCCLLADRLGKNTLKPGGASPTCCYRNQVAFARTLFQDSCISLKYSTADGHPSSLPLVELSKCYSNPAQSVHFRGCNHS